MISTIEESWPGAEISKYFPENTEPELCMSKAKQTRIDEALTQQHGPHMPIEVGHVILILTELLDIAFKVILCF